eukprot:jgi/Ulvmu1/2791/UM140_0021.1
MRNANNGFGRTSPKHHVVASSPVHSRTPASNEVPKASTGYALLLIFTWYTMSTALSIYNKKVLGKRYGILDNEPFPAPLLMTSVQFLAQYAMAWLSLKCVAARTLDPGEPRTWAVWTRTVLPNGVATGLDIGFSNLSLVFITLSFYTMCKSSAPLFLLLCAFIWRIESPTWSLAGTVAVISGGLLMLVAGEVEFNVVGFLLVMTAAAMSGVRWTITQILLQGGDSGGGHRVQRGTALEVMESLTPVMSATTMLLSLASEPLIHIVRTNIYFSSAPHLLLSLALISVGAFIAFFMVLVEFMLISSTSALTFMVAGVFKEIVTVMVAHFTYGDQFTALNGAGLAVLLCGVGLFNYQQWRKAQAVHGQVQAVSLTDDAQVLLAVEPDAESDEGGFEMEAIGRGKGGKGAANGLGSPTKRGMNGHAGGQGGGA